MFAAQEGFTGFNYSASDGVNNVQLLFGPNGSGKSTYLRTLAIIQVLAQIGSFVPVSTLDSVVSAFVRATTSNAVCCPLQAQYAKLRLVNFIHACFPTSSEDSREVELDDLACILRGLGEKPRGKCSLVSRSVTRIAACSPAALRWCSGVRGRSVSHRAKRRRL